MTSLWHSPTPGGSRKKLVEVSLPNDLYQSLLVMSVSTGVTLEQLVIGMLVDWSAVEELRTLGRQQSPG